MDIKAWIKAKLSEIELSLWSKIFIVVVLLETVAIIAGSIVQFATTDSYFYTAIIAFTVLAVAFFAIEAVIQENEFQLIGFLVSSIFLCVRVTYSLISEGSNILNSLSILIPAIIVYVTQVVYFIIIVPVYRSFGWKIFKIVGSNPRLIKLYRIYSAFLTCIKIDIQFTIVIAAMGYFLIQFSLAAKISFFSCFVLTLIFAPVCVIVGVWRELRLVVVLWLVWSTVLPIYLIYKIFDLTIVSGTKDIIVPPDSDAEATRIVLISMCATAIVCRVIMIVLGSIVTVNMHKGLKPVLMRRTPNKPTININTSDGFLLAGTDGNPADNCVPLTEDGPENL